jgi:uncharacterized protein YbjT (DUF2867 family)
MVARGGLEQPLVAAHRLLENESIDQSTASILKVSRRACPGKGGKHMKLGSYFSDRFQALAEHYCGIAMSAGFVFALVLSSLTGAASIGHTEEPPACNPADNTGVLILGGTGRLGSYHVRQLSAAGERVLILARPTSTFERIEGSAYEIIIGDLRDADAIAAAVAEAKPAVIIDASNLPGIRLDDGDSFYWHSIRHQIAAAKAACVTQIIQHSARGARAFLTQPPAAFRDDPRVINYMRDVARAEIALEHSGLPYTIVLNSNLPPEPAAPTGGGTLSEDLAANVGITRSDLARITNACILNQACYGRTYNGIDLSDR